jgi:hypothetical protein
LILLGLVFFIVVQATQARAKRSNQIPNGSKWGCANCHVNPAGGGQRNAFGADVEPGFLSAPGAAGDVLWGNALALLESDDDGYANGVELQDPDGAWIMGSANPGTYSAVSNPGNITSVPTTAVQDPQTSLLPDRMILTQNYPNPFNGSTQIRVILPYRDRVSLEIFDSKGRSVWASASDPETSGEVIWTWDGRDRNGAPLASGTYICLVRSSREIRSQKMVFIK